MILNILSEAEHRNEYPREPLGIATGRGNRETELGAYCKERPPWEAGLFETVLQSLLR